VAKTLDARQKALWHKDLEYVEYFANPFQSWQSGKERSLKMPDGGMPVHLDCPSISWEIGVRSSAQ
jgi:hypothetical protein